VGDVPGDVPTPLQTLRRRPADAAAGETTHGAVGEVMCGVVGEVMCGVVGEVIAVPISCGAGCLRQNLGCPAR
jgi:hypothetical protein